MTFAFRDEGMTEGSVVTVRIATPSGDVHMMAEAEEFGTAGKPGLRLHGLHIHADGGPYAVGLANLRQLARWALEETGYDELVVEGAARTSGAGPGRIPRVLRFARRAVALPGPEP